MNLAYRRWLIPKGNVFCPSGAGIAKLVLRLRKENWIADAPSGTFARRAVEPGARADEPMPHALEASWIDDPDRADLALRWPRKAPSMLRSALALTGDEVAYAFGIDRADDFVHPLADGIDLLDSTCACGDDVGFVWDAEEIVCPFGESNGIFCECESCSRTFDPAKREAAILDPATGKKTPVRGGAAYRFAIVVEGDASLAKAAKSATFHPDLKALVENEFGRDFYEIGAIDGG